MVRSEPHTGIFSALNSEVLASAEAKLTSARTALKELFALLEDYAPIWYTEEHHNLAFDALEESAEDATRDAAPRENVLQIQRPRYNARGVRTGKPRHA
jgi:hypothetical protein